MRVGGFGGHDRIIQVYWILFLLLDVVWSRKVGTVWCRCSGGGLAGLVWWENRSGRWGL
jgi:hypothetical protein